MRTRKKWSEDERVRLINLSLSGEFTFHEIAKKMGRSRNAIAGEVQRLGVSNKAYLLRKTKYKYLMKPVFEYFLTHSQEQTRKKFNLTATEFKSIFTIGYRDPKLAHLRKDTRTKEPWTLQDWLFMIQRCGLRPRSFIGKKLGRGKDRVIKERLKLCNSGSKWLNGMPRTWALELWGESNLPAGFKTDAGPSGGRRTNFHFIVIPWPTCESLADKNKTPAHIKACIRAMSKFQKWIHQVNSDRGVTRKVREVLNER